MSDPHVTPDRAAMCSRCKERPGTVKWVGDAGAMGYLHGAYEMWCERCVVKAQLSYAIERASVITSLRLRLRELEGDHA